MTSPTFNEPTLTEKIFNRIFGFLVGLGFFSNKYLLQVRGRKSGKPFSTPVNMLELNDKKYLVAPRGQTQWVRNAEASGEITLKRGGTRLQFRLRPLADAEKPEVLKKYLDNYKSEVQRFFTVPAGSSPEAFAPIAASYPAFELLVITR